MSKRNNFLTFFLLGIFLISFASSFEFDNVKTYDPITRTATITNAFGLGDVISTAMLESPLNVKVGAGEDQLVGWFTYITTEEDVAGSFGELYLEDLKNGNQIFRGGQYKVHLSHEESVDDYEIVCEEKWNTFNQTLIEVCEPKEIGSHIETVWEWMPITNPNIELFSNTLYQIGIFVDVEVGDYGDWKPTFSGKEIPEWAEWTADLNVNIISYYKLDGDGSGDIVIDSVETNNGTNDGATPSVTGRILTAYDFEASEEDKITLPDMDYVSANALSISAWINAESFPGTAAIVSHKSPGGIRAFQLAVFSNKIQWITWNSATTITNIGGVGDNLNPGTWYHVVATYKNGEQKIYIDADLKGSAVPSGTIMDDTGDMHISFQLEALGNWFDGIIDEVAIWDRALTQPEVTQIFDAQKNGFENGSYTDDFGGAAPSITLNSPSSTDFTSPQSLTINFTASDGINLTNVQLYVNDILNQSNASGINNTIYLFDLNLGDGEFTIYGTATNNNSEQTNSSSIQINIDSTPFIEFLTPPTIVDGGSTNLTTVPMKINTTTTILKNITYSLRNTNTTTFTQFYDNETFNITFVDIPQGAYNYDVEICTTTDKCNITETRSLVVHTTPLGLVIHDPQPIINYLLLGNNLTLNWTVTEAGENLTEHVTNCTYEYNEVITILDNTVCVEVNQTSFLYVLGINNLTFTVTDAFGLVNSTLVEWDFLILENNVTYIDPITESTPNIITQVVTINAGGSFQQGVIDYNGTNFTTSASVSGDVYSLSATVTPQSVDTTQNINFSFYVNVDGSWTQLQEYTQEVIALNLTNCTSGNVLINMSLYKEEERTSLLGDIEIDLDLISKANGDVVESLSIMIENKSNFLICLDPISSTILYNLNAEIKYSSEDYAAEFYFIQGANATDYPINISLFDLHLNSSTEFLVKYQDSNLVTVTNAVVQLLRKYISTGNHETVEAPLTSDNGEVVLHIDLNTNIYKAIVVKDGEILDIFNNIVFDCENELSGQCTHNLFGIIDSQNSISPESINDFSYAISDANNIITTTFSIPSGVTSSVNVILRQVDNFGDETLCNETVVSSSGSIDCAYVDTIGDSIIYLSINKGGNQEAVASFFVVADDTLDFLGNNYFLVFVMLLSLIGVAMSSPEWIVMNSLLAILLSGGLWLLGGMNFVVGLGNILWLVVIAGIIIMKMAKQEDR